jgi:hypothetical protein
MIKKNLVKLEFLKKDSFDYQLKSYLNSNYYNLMKKLNSFIKYLKAYLFKIFPKICNYSGLIHHFQMENYNNIFLEKLYDQYM